MNGFYCLTKLENFFLFSLHLLLLSISSLKSNTKFFSLIWFYTNKQESWSRGDQYFGGSKRNDTSTSLKASPQLNLRTENSFNFSQEGHHPNVSRALPKNYCIDSCYTIPTTTGRLGQKYGRDRERMKDELANSNSMARTGSGILPGGIVGWENRICNWQVNILVTFL
jgi:hypothetical protein